MTIELNCPTCGNNRFTFPAETDEPVSCDSCGAAIGTYGEVQERVAEEVIRSDQLT